MTDSKKHDGELKIVFIVYLACVLLTFLAGAYMRDIEAEHDEAIYRQIAESIVTGRGISMYNLPMLEYKRVLYSLAISPAFLVANRVAQNYLILLLNAIYICSAIFPYALISRRVIPNEKMRRVSYWFFLLTPDFRYAETFLTENLFLPASLWLVYLCLRFHGQKNQWKRLAAAVLLGAYIYAMTLIKNTAWVFLPGIALFLGVEWLAGVMGLVGTDDGRGVFKRLKGLGIRVLEFALILGGFFALQYVVDHLWFVSDVGVVVQSSTVAGAISTARYFPFYGKKAFLDFCIYVVVASGVLPLVLPMLFWRELGERSRKLYLFLGSMALCTVVLIISLITVNEDSYNALPTAHLRYLCYLWPLLFVIFFSMYEDVKRAVDCKRQVVFLALMVLLAFLFRGVMHRTSIDDMPLFGVWYYTSWDCWENSTVLIWGLRVVFVFSAIILFPLFDKNRKRLYQVYVGAIALMLLVNNVTIAWFHHRQYHLTDEEVKEALALEEFVKNHPDEQFLVMGTSQWGQDALRISDTFLTQRNVITLQGITLGIATEGVDCLDLTENRMHSYLGYIWDIDKVHYLLVERTKEGETYPITGDNYVRLDDLGQEWFDIYELKDPMRIPLLDVQQ